MSSLASVARRLEREVGLPAADAMRIARKLDKLASSVSWATPLAEKEKHRKARVSTGIARRKSSKEQTTKKR